MKEKIISGFLGAILGGVIVFSYGYFMNSNTSNIGPIGNGTPPGNFGSGSLDISNMSDEQLEKMAERAGITKEELKTKLENGEDMRSLMGGQRSTGRGNIGTGFTQ
ncbi:MAG: hypothetical protein PHI37_02325 [Candidatus Gracilibacteria bacterium]|nr:hypothetical protein [Candidatus Gracilibacteria bacterium]